MRAPRSAVASRKTPKTPQNALSEFAAPSREACVTHLCAAMRHAALSSLQAPPRGPQSRKRHITTSAHVSPRALSATAAPKASVKFVKFQVRGAAGAVFGARV